MNKDCSVAFDALQMVICKLEGKIQLLEIDNEFLKNNGDSLGAASDEILNRTLAVWEDFCFLQTLLKGKSKALENAREINRQLKEYLKALEPLLPASSSSIVASNSAIQSGNATNFGRLQEGNSSFCEGIAFLDEREWESVPKYMRGKFNCSRINDYISCLNGMANELIRLQKVSSNVGSGSGIRFSKEQRDRLMEYRNAALPETMGKVFLLESDVKRTSEKTEMVLRGMNTILRHLGRVKEIRGGGHVRIVFAK